MIDGIIDALALIKHRLNRENENRLTAELYNDLHLRQDEASSLAKYACPALRAKDVFGARHRFESGWRPAETSTSNALIFEGHGLYIKVNDYDITPDGLLRLPAIRDRYSPGFCALLSSHEPPETGTRVYLGVRQDRASNVGYYLADILPRITDGFVVKALTDRKYYYRPDSFTIYIGNDVRDSVLRVLGTNDLQPWLNRRAAVSRFAKSVRTGISWMEGHASTSAGEQRARCVARALRLHWDSDRIDLARALRYEFISNGFDPECPYRLLATEMCNGN